LIVSTIAADIIERTPEERDAFDAILGILRHRTGTDFSCYRPSTIRRRVLNRMISVGASTFADYLTFLRDSEAESGLLLQRVTIKVSRFYRNGEVFDMLRERVIPELTQRRMSEPLTIWSAGCGYGEEPYTLAMLLDNAGVAGGVEATDIDRSALSAATEARYSEAALGELPLDWRARYLQALEQNYEVMALIRTRVRFAHHDLTMIASTPTRRFDLVCCRNVLIYLAHDVQLRVLASLIGSIRPGGYLCLGEAEWPAPSLAAGLEPLGHKTRVFRVLGG
jgi:chemotaxis methyl-accepting protein methylase